MADIDIISGKLEQALNGLAAARNAAEEWRRGRVMTEPYTAAQRTALRTAFVAGLNAAKAAIAAVETELTNP